MHLGVVLLAVAFAWPGDVAEALHLYPTFWREVFVKLWCLCSMNVGDDVAWVEVPRLPSPKAAA